MSVSLDEALDKNKTTLVFMICDLSMKLESALGSMRAMGVSLHEVAGHHGDFSICAHDTCKAVLDLVKLHQPARVPNVP